MDRQNLISDSAYHVFKSKLCINTDMSLMVSSTIRYTIFASFLIIIDTVMLRQKTERLLMVLNMESIRYKISGKSIMILQSGLDFVS